jgi:hypothetical protein
MLYRLYTTLSLLIVCIGNNTLANEVKAEFSGFASLAVSYSDDPEIEFSSNYLNNSEAGWSIARDSILGGQANISLNKNWDSVFQMVLQDRAYEGIDNYLELAFLRFRPTRNWAIRAGRMNSDLYLLSEYPYVSFAYLWVRPPHDYYSFASAGGRYDGADIEYSQALADGFLRVKLAAGQTTTKLKSDNNDFFIQFDNLLSLSANYAVNEWILRFSVSRGDIASYNLDTLKQFAQALKSVPNFIWPQAVNLAEGLEGQGHKISYAAFGLTYDSDNWLIQSEVGISETKWLVAPSNINAYLSAGYRIDDVTLYSGISLSKNRHDVTDIIEPQFPSGTPEQISLPIQQLAAITKSVVERPVVNQHSFNIGVKWHYSDSLVIKAQIDHFVIEPLGGGLWGINDPADVDKGHQINVFSLSSSVVF